jgi:hypothetical protein
VRDIAQTVGRVSVVLILTCCASRSGSPADREVVMSKLMESRTIAVSIEAAPERVYAFCSDPRNFPKWVPSFADRVEVVDGRWLLHSQVGVVTLRFVDSNPLGVLDHYVTDATGVTFYNPMRVIANGAGSHVSFTLFRRSGVSDTDYNRDAESVQSDLAILKRLLEAQTG